MQLLAFAHLLRKELIPKIYDYKNELLVRKSLVDVPHAIIMLPRYALVDDVGLSVVHDGSEEALYFLEDRE